MTIDEIREAIRTGRALILMHAFEEAVDDRVSVGEVVDSVFHGEIIEDYPDRKPLPRCLVLGWTRNGIPLHSVWEDDRATSGLVALVTVYRPDPADWIEWRYRR